MKKFFEIINETKNSYLLKTEEGNVWVKKAYVRLSEGLFDPEGFDWRLNRQLVKKELAQEDTAKQGPFKVAPTRETEKALGWKVRVEASTTSNEVDCFVWVWWPKSLGSISAAEFEKRLHKAAAERIEFGGYTRLVRIWEWGVVRE